MVQIVADEQPAGEREAITIPTAYVGEDQPAVFANHFAVSLEKDDLILVLAQLTPPIITGSREDWAEQAKRIPFVPIRIQGRFAMNVSRARDLYGILGKQLAAYDAAKAESGGDAEPD